MIDFIDKTTEHNGTPINRTNMMAVQGFVGSTIKYNDDGSFTETNSNGEKLTTKFDNFANITQVFVGEKTITRTITFSQNGWEVKLT